MNLSGTDKDIVSTVADISTGSFKVNGINKGDL